MIYAKFGKRAIDLVASLLMFLILSPIFILVAIMLKATIEGSPFFLQKRPGKNQVPFHVIKFKTMTNERDKNGDLLPDHLRLTKLGRFIRNTSLDEIPQLLNVISGKMSLIGPRPLLLEYLPFYNSTQLRRHEVRPGITGWAQVNGRNLLEWKERFKLDVWYVDNISLMLDLKIVWITAVKVFKKEGVSSETYVTMEKFKGN
ncbi:sugar transferase [Algoriphagus sp.]|uniref:sugar transferase n=1 Tax=Algoriphagus sp. TaxID=1872435 RepID=UPI0039190289